MKRYSIFHWYRILRVHYRWTLFIQTSPMQSVFERLYFSCGTAVCESETQRPFLAIVSRATSCFSLLRRPGRPCTAHCHPS